MIRMILSASCDTCTWLILVCVCLFSYNGNGGAAKPNHVDYYTSQHGLRKLALAEREIANALSTYINVLEKRLAKAKRFLTDYESSGVVFNSTLRIASEKSSDAEQFRDLAAPLTAHPLRSYRLLRRYVQDLPVIEKELRSDDERKFLKLTEKVKSQVPFPTQRDIRGAVEGILRVHDTYNFNIDDFTTGKFDDLITNTSMDAADCFFIGVYALQATIFTRAIEWLERSFTLASSEENPSISRKEVRQKLEQVVVQHNEAIRSRSKNPYLFTKPVMLEDALHGTNRQRRKRLLDVEVHLSRNKEAGMTDLTNFAALCSGKRFKVTAKSSQIRRCWYENSQSLTKLLPLKIERHHVGPDILQFHDFISSTTIANILKSATETMSRSQVHVRAQQDNKMISSTRTSTSTWLRDDVRSTFQEINKAYRRVEHFSGLKIIDRSASEDLQVSCYGIAGHFNPHMDTVFSSVDKNSFDKEEIEKGDRLATIMIYLSDVVRGGATVFSRIGVTVEPVKGSALFWYNMDERGEPDSNTLHGGCPILYGNKCVSNKWIRFNSQLRQCSAKKT